LWLSLSLPMLLSLSQIGEIGATRRERAAAGPCRRGTVPRDRAAA
jgi:hypothetical protein